SSTRRVGGRLRRSESMWKIAALESGGGGESNPRPKAQTGVSPSAQEPPSTRNPNDGEADTHHERPTGSRRAGTVPERAEVHNSMRCDLRCARGDKTSSTKWSAPAMRQPWAT